MSEQVIEPARHETMRLLNHFITLLETLTTPPDLLHTTNKSTADGGTLNTRKVQRWLSDLRDELHKVETLEMVISIVGTMKSGKSTTINAIVGTSLLPSRAEPMTTYPTLVRHTPGRSEPHLIVPFAQSLSRLITDLKSALHKFSSDDPARSHSLWKNQHLSKIADDLLSDEYADFLATISVDEAAIFCGPSGVSDFLFRFNDVIRLCGQPFIQIDISKYIEPSFKNFPVIEIEFHHLIDQDVIANGRFSLLDTPGPNEASMGSRLRDVVVHEIERASAVALILNAQELGSNASDEVERNLASETARLSNRVFAFANKFDEVSISWENNEDGFKRHISGELSRDTAPDEHELPPERIYPASALYALLGSRAVREIDIHGTLPDHSTEWVRHFAKEAYGNRGLRALANASSSEIREEAVALWHESRFDIPLNATIRNGAQNAAFLAIEAALDRLLYYNENLTRFLETQRFSFSEEISVVRDLIHNTKSDLERIASAHSHVNDLIDSLTDEFLKEAEAFCAALHAEIGEKISLYFSSGSMERYNTLRDEALKRIRRKSALGLFSSILGISELLLGDFTRQRDFVVPSKKEIKYEGEDHAVKARNLTKRINNTMRELFEYSQNRISSKLQEASKILENESVEILEKEIRPIVTKAESEFKKYGLNLFIKFPDPDIKIRRDNESLDASNLIDTQSEKKTKSIKVKKFWKGRVARGLGWLLGKESWGYEEITENVSFSVVNFTKIEKFAKAQADNVIDDIKAQASLFVEERIKVRVSEYMESVETILAEVTTDFVNGLERREMRAEEITDYLKKISYLAQQSSDVQHGSELTRENLKAGAMAGITE